uniref:Uncharacterized protein n=1 Tax=Arundo donax TaxID=35708 RepID=A0A0A8ZN79_ARUDO
MQVDNMMMLGRMCQHGHPIALGILTILIKSQKIAEMTCSNLKLGLWIERY